MSHKIFALLSPSYSILASKVTEKKTTLKCYKKISNLLTADMKVAQNQQRQNQKMQLTSSEMDKEEEKGCINDFLGKMSIF